MAGDNAAGSQRTDIIAQTAPPLDPPEPIWPPIIPPTPTQANPANPFRPGTIDQTKNPYFFPGYSDEPELWEPTTEPAPERDTDSDRRFVPMPLQLKMFMDNRPAGPLNKDVLNKMAKSDNSVVEAVARYLRNHFDSMVALSPTGKKNEITDADLLLLKDLLPQNNHDAVLLTAVEEMKDHFPQVDKNHDGKLTKKEINDYEEKFAKNHESSDFEFAYSTANAWWNEIAGRDGKKDSISHDDIAATEAAVYKLKV